MDKTIDLPGLRLHALHRIPDEPFTERDLKLTACCVLAYFTKFKTARQHETEIPLGEAEYLLEAFGFETTVLALTKRQFVAGLAPHYSLAGQHPQLVYMLFRTFLDQRFQERLLNLGFVFPKNPQT